MEVRKAEPETLLRSGIGPISARRIVTARRHIPADGGLAQAGRSAETRHSFFITCETAACARGFALLRLYPFRQLEAMERVSSQQRNAGSCRCSMRDKTMEDVIFQYDGSFQGFLCCVFDSYFHKEFPIAFCSDENVFPTSRAGSNHHGRTIASRYMPVWSVFPKRRCGFCAEHYLTCMEDKELRLYTFIRKLYDQGPSLCTARRTTCTIHACALRLASKR